MMDRIFVTDQIVTISNVLSLEECREQMGRAQLAGFDAQARGSTIRTEVRRRRAAIEDPESAARLWERIAPLIPPLEPLYRPPLEPYPPVSDELSAYRAVGLNPRLRFYHYEPGDRFPSHFDIAYEESPETRSFLTIIVYLNEGCRGGETRFGDVVINPRAGMALLFPHELQHEGTEILEGWKCVLRSDIMYRLGD